MPIADGRLFEATQFAIAYLSVSSAAADDDSRPALHRTVHIEQYREGVRLVATDSYMIAHSWVPRAGHEDALAPEIDELPDGTVTVIDAHRRGQALMKAIRKIAKAEKDREHFISLSELFGRPGQLDGFEAREVKFDLNKGDETLTLGVWDADWITWRSLMSEADGDAEISKVALSSEMIARLSRVLSPLSDAVVSFDFTTEVGLVFFSADDGWTEVEGAWMPVRTSDTTLPGSDDE